MEIRDTELLKIINFVKGTPKATKFYPQLVEYLIGQRYNTRQELATIRQRDVKPLEFQAYDEYCEECKQYAKRILGLEK